MLQKVFDTQDLPVGERLGAWKEVVSHSLTPNLVDVDRAEEFQASMRLGDMSDTQVVGLSYTSLRNQRTARMIRRSGPELYALALNVRGHQRIRQSGRETVLGVGDLVVYATSDPYESWVNAGAGTAASTVALIPRAAVPFAYDTMKRLVATRLSGREGIGALAAHLLVRLREDAGLHRPADAPRLGTVLVDLFTALTAHHLEAEAVVPPESRERTLVLAVRAFIQRHLSDPELSPASVAAAHNISVRTLHRLFRDEETTVARLIREQRLEKCRRDLADPACSGRPIHAVAARWGFADAAAFSHAFRAVHGCTPTEYRRSRLEARPPKGPGIPPGSHAPEGRRDP
ncbi:AraC-type DNA-binding protein [Nonomuraea maritima]|uniref:AraC-type DNA-binding protein n=1 Tax=Nonomuraea maritima TaxID=683260 RepID=A0A1G9DGZ3_9ACTN|nr:helix-turn-helix domain-containing protein [Nonomuraea maritima]SDK63143.1 AraC-type DNA-binding protein [Nonomuraea maritima]